MLGNSTACWEILLHAGKYYCMVGNITACREILLHTGKYYCILGNITACREILLHTGKYYCILGNITGMLGNITACWEISLSVFDSYQSLEVLFLNGFLLIQTLNYNNVYLFRITLLLICVIDIFDFAIVEIVLEWSH